MHSWKDIENIFVKKSVEQEVQYATVCVKKRRNKCLYWPLYK